MPPVRNCQGLIVSPGGAVWLSGFGFFGTEGELDEGLFKLVLGCFRYKSGLTIETYVVDRASERGLVLIAATMAWLVPPITRSR